MPSERWEDWSSNQGEISQRLRALADQWDRGLTEARPDLLEDVRGGVIGLSEDMYWLVQDAPHTPADAAAARVDSMEDK